MSEHQRRSLVRELRDEVARCADRDQLLVRARQWLYKNKLVIVHERAIRTLIAAALAQLEVETGTAIAASVDPATLDRWRASVSELRPDGQTQQSWLWAAPAKHSTRHALAEHHKMDELLEQLTETEFSNPGWLAIAKKLSETVHHHLQEEEHGFFQQAGKILLDAQKTALAKQYQQEYKKYKKIEKDSLV
jgi:hypothetical protein